MKNELFTVYRNGNCHCGYPTALYYYSLMKQSQMSPTFDSAAETVQCHAVHAGSEPVACHPEPPRLPAASPLPGSPPQDAAGLQAAAKYRYSCILEMGRNRFLGHGSLILAGSGQVRSLGSMSNWVWGLIDPSPIQSILQSKCV